jgi:hypothetical protein
MGTIIIIFIIKHLWRVSQFLPDYTTQLSRRLSFSCPSLIYHILHLSRSGFISEPLGHFQTLENSREFVRTPSTLMWFGECSSSTPHRRDSLLQFSHHTCKKNRTTQIVSCTTMYVVKSCTAFRRRLRQLSSCAFFVILLFNTQSVNWVLICLDRTI